MVTLPGELSNDDLRLKFSNPDQARSTAYPRSKKLNPKDIEAFQAEKFDIVLEIMSVINGHGKRKAPKPGRKQSGQWNDLEKHEWEEWNDTPHATVRSIIDGEWGHAKLEARSWMIFEQIVKNQMDGGVEKYSKKDALTTSRERLDSVLDHLEAYPIIRAYALDDMDIPRFVTNPSLYAKQKVAWKRTNLGRLNTRRDGPSPAPEEDQSEDETAEEPGIDDPERPRGNTLQSSTRKKRTRLEAENAQSEKSTASSGNGPRPKKAKSSNAASGISSGSISPAPRKSNPKRTRSSNQLDASVSVHEYQATGGHVTDAQPAVRVD